MSGMLYIVSKYFSPDIYYIIGPSRGNSCCCLDHLNSFMHTSNFLFLISFTPTFSQDPHIKPSNASRAYTCFWGDQIILERLNDLHKRFYCKSVLRWKSESKSPWLLALAFLPIIIFRLFSETDFPSFRYPRQFILTELWFLFGYKGDIARSGFSPLILFLMNIGNCMTLRDLALVGVHLIYWMSTILPLVFVVVNPDFL